MSTIAAYKDAYKKTGRVFIMILIMALLLISLTACNGLGSGELKVIVYKNGRTVNDVYIALYDGSNRINMDIR